MQRSIRSLQTLEATNLFSCGTSRGPPRTRSFHTPIDTDDNTLACTPLSTPNRRSKYAILRHIVCEPTDPTCRKFHENTETIAATGSDVSRAKNGRGAKIYWRERADSTRRRTIHELFYRRPLISVTNPDEKSTFVLSGQVLHYLLLECVYQCFKSYRVGSHQLKIE